MIRASEFRPVNGNLLVEFVGSDLEQTEAGIYLPQSADKDHGVRAVVRAIARGYMEFGTLIEHEAKVGDTVLVLKRAYPMILAEEGRMFLVGAESLLGVVGATT